MTRRGFLIFLASLCFWRKPQSTTILRAYEPIPGGPGLTTITIGCMPPYSVIDYPQIFVFVDQERVHLWPLPIK